ncbi:MAG TPA: GDP-mannose 4,6-dehydratase [Zeimonas sp.]
MSAAAVPDTVLLTGAAGFTGRYVAQALRARGWRVVGLVHDEAATVAGAPAPSVADDPFEPLFGDVLDRVRLRTLVEEVRPSRVVHLAGLAFVAHDDVESIYRTNLLGTRNLLEALDAAGKPLESIVLASSANVYGNSPADPLDESVAPAPANDYAVSKLAMEYMARCWMPRLPITIVRPFNYTGVGQSERFLLPKIVAHFARGECSIELGNLDVERDFSDVRAVAEIYARLLSRAFAGETFDLCSGRACSLRSVLDTMAKIAGYSIDVRVNPAFVRANEVHRLRGSGVKLRAALGELPSYPLEETLRWMHARMRERCASDTE